MQNTVVRVLLGLAPKIRLDFIFIEKKDTSKFITLSTNRNQYWYIFFQDSIIVLKNKK